MPWHHRDAENAAMEEEKMEMGDTGQPGTAQAGGGWNLPQPDTVPRPTYWPAVLAFGCSLVGFGVLTSYLFSALGALISVIAVLKWIREIVHEQQKK
jgi:hypothetical protein